MSWCGQFRGLTWREQSVAPHHKKGLKLIQQFCKEQWANIPQSWCAHLIETYPNRLMAVVKAKGGCYCYFIFFFFFNLFNCPRRKISMQNNQIGITSYDPEITSNIPCTLLPIKLGRPDQLSNLPIWLYICITCLKLLAWGTNEDFDQFLVNRRQYRRPDGNSSTEGARGCASCLQQWFFPCLLFFPYRWHIW